jgi:chromosome segregation ATPase
MGAVLVGLVFWVGSTLNTAQTQMAVLEERVVTLTTEVTSLRNQVASGIDDRYRRADAQRDFGRVWNHLASVDEQLDELERRLENNTARDKEAHP